MTGPKQVGLVYNPEVSEAAEHVEMLVRSLGLGSTSWTHSVDDVDEIREALGNTSLLVVVGGDGTILRTVRVSAPSEVPIVGINMGRVGFMAELFVDESVEKLPAYLEGQVRVEERMMLEATVSTAQDSYPKASMEALNEIVVGRGSVARLHEITTTIDGVLLESYRADAVIVATATGSTGYGLSAGGPIIYPESDVILVQPVAAHIGLRDGLVIPGDSVIELTVCNGHPAALSVDGFLDSSLGHQDKVTVKRGPHKARFLRANPPSSFYNSLSRRLGLTKLPSHRRTAK